MPLMTDGDRIVSARRVHQKEVIPRPFKEEVSLKQTLEDETVRVKKIETQQPNIANPNQDNKTLSADSVTSQRSSFAADRLLRNLTRSIASVSLARAVDGVMGWWCGTVLRRLSADCAMMFG